MIIEWSFDHKRDRLQPGNAPILVPRKWERLQSELEGI